MSASARATSSGEGAPTLRVGGGAGAPAGGLLELHQENFAPPDGSGVELLILSAAPGSAAEDGHRLLAGLDPTGTGEPGPAPRSTRPAGPQVRPV